MGRVYDDDLSVNECPYTGRICYKWECETCEIEQEERKYMQAFDEPCEDVISREELLKAIDTWDKFGVDANTKIVPVKDCYVPYIHYDDVIKCIKGMPSVAPQQKTGYCKNCKYFEYDSVAKVDGIPLIVAHEICKKWGDGCKTKEDGYCFLFEPQESEE